MQKYKQIFFERIQNVYYKNLSFLYIRSQGKVTLQHNCFFPPQFIFFYIYAQKKVFSHLGTLFFQKSQYLYLINNISSLSFMLLHYILLGIIIGHDRSMSTRIGCAHVLVKMTLQNNPLNHHRCVSWYGDYLKSKRIKIKL